MKKSLLLILIFTINFSLGQNKKYLSENYEFKNGEIAYLFGNNVKFRDAPNSDSNVVNILKIGEEIEIIEKTKSTLLYDGIESSWYKVRNKDKIGFVLGGLISLDRIVINDLTYLVGLKKDEQALFVKTRLITKGKEFEENIAQLSTSEFSIEAFGNKGIENIKSVFLIDYLSESCGTDGGGIYLFYNGDKLIKAFEFSKIADADLYWFIEEYTFPDEKKSLYGKILYRKEVGETKEYDTEWTETKTTQRLLEWKDNQLIPKIEPEKK